MPTSSDTQIIAPTAVQYANLEFSPDGNYIYFKRLASATQFNLFRATVLGGTPQLIAGRQITNFAGQEIVSLSWSSDGKQLAILRMDYKSDIVPLRSENP